MAKITVITYTYMGQRSREYEIKATGHAVMPYTLHGKRGAAYAVSAEGRVFTPDARSTTIGYVDLAECALAVQEGK